jgi:thioredoxin 1
MLGPIMEELAEDNADKNAKIIKVNVDNNPELSQTFQISSIPAVYVMKAGKPVEVVVGANPKTVYQERIDKYLADDDEVKLAA